MMRLTLRRWCLVAAVAGTGCASTGPMTGPAAFPGAPVRTLPAASLSVDVGALEPRTGAVIQTALSYLGTPYRFGGHDPATGFDCSGLVRYAFDRNQIDLPRTAEEQFTAGRPVRPDALRPGDLVFFSTIGPGATHVGIVLDASEPTFVHAPSTGGVVRVERFDTGYWRSRFVGARRIL